MLFRSLISFEWSTVDRKANAFLDNGRELIEEEIIPNITQPDPIPPVPPQIVVPEFLLIVDNIVPVSDTFDIFGGDVKPGEAIPTYTYNPKREPEKVEDEPYIIVEEMPRFLGGDVNKFSKWVNERIKYPQVPQESGIQGRVIVSFVIEPDGSLSNFIVTRNIDPLLDAEALRVVQSSPKWTPGKQRDVPVRVRCSISINYVLK